MLLNQFKLYVLCTVASGTIFYMCDNNVSPSDPPQNLSASIQSSLLNDSTMNVTINLCSGNSVLKENLTFSNRDIVSFLGNCNSTFTCSGHSVGISFENVRYIKVVSLTLKNCGRIQGLYVKNLYIQFSSSILIQNGSNIWMMNSSIINSEGLGMVILQSSIWKS